RRKLRGKFCEFAQVANQQSDLAGSYPDRGAGEYFGLPTAQVRRVFAVLLVEEEDQRAELELIAVAQCSRGGDGRVINVAAIGAGQVHDVILRAFPPDGGVLA